jgi:hypothetical protein
MFATLMLAATLTLNVDCDWGGLNDALTGVEGPAVVYVHNRCNDPFVILPPKGATIIGDGAESTLYDGVFYVDGDIRGEYRFERIGGRSEITVRALEPRRASLTLVETEARVVTTINADLTLYRSAVVGDWDDRSFVWTSCADVTIEESELIGRGLTVGSCWPTGASFVNVRDSVVATSIPDWEHQRSPVYLVGAGGRVNGVFKRVEGGGDEPLIFAQGDVRYVEIGR